FGKTLNVSGLPSHLGVLHSDIQQHSRSFFTLNICIQIHRKIFPCFLHIDAHAGTGAAPASKIKSGGKACEPTFLAENGQSEK
ncbi:hypothetical protein ABET14_12075, partial [Heyndrickxia coagulans]|uniref:hypothetical protein n=1 Tax=Heyndrickxia coagulans TaxID=1398 RepID=UPI003D2205B9